jgi:hypothetical protein
MKIMNTPKGADRASVPAEIVITVKKFRAVLSAQEARDVRATDYVMRMKRKHPRVSLQNDTVFVRAPGAVIRLTVASSAGDKERYYPAGITFVRENGRDLSDALRLGRPDFRQDRIVLDGRALTFADRFAKGKVNIRYKFSLILQRGSDGAIGIVDPGIENDSEH